MTRQGKNEKTVFYHQRDRRWAGEIMTRSAKWTDTIGDWGCLVTCLSNVIEILMNRKFTPKDMNDLLVQDKAYQYLADPGTPEKAASVLLWEPVRKLFPAVEFTLFQKMITPSAGDFVIAKTAGKFHFVNLLCIKYGYKAEDCYIVYDVWDGIVRIYGPDDFEYYHVLRLKGV
jgi:hypothetical protein